MAKVIIKTAKANDPIYKEGITISSSLGAVMMRARQNYLKRAKKCQENLVHNDKKVVGPVGLEPTTNRL